MANRSGTWTALAILVCATTARAVKVKWQSTQPLLDVANGDLSLYGVAGPVLRGRTVYAIGLAAEADGSQPRRELLRLDLDAPPGAKPLILCRGPGSPGVRRGWIDANDLDERHHEAAIDAQAGILCADVDDDDGAYWCTSEGRVDRYPLSGGPARVFTPPEQPSPHFQASVELRGHLYAAVGAQAKEGGLIDIDLIGAAPTRTLALSGRGGQASPFDGGPAFVVCGMVADRARKRVVFYVESPLWPAGQAGNSGLWEYSPTTGQFRRLAADPPSLVHAAPAPRPAPENGQFPQSAWWFPASVGAVVDHRLVVLTHASRLTYDLATDTATTLPQRYVGRSWLQPPFVPRGDWMYGTFGRFKPGHERATQFFEYLPREDGGTEEMRIRYVLPVDDQQVVGGNPLGLWLFTLPKR